MYRVKFSVFVAVSSAFKKLFQVHQFRCCFYDIIRLYKISLHIILDHLPRGGAMHVGNEQSAK